MSRRSCAELGLYVLEKPVAHQCPDASGAPAHGPDAAGIASRLGDVRARVQHARAAHAPVPPPRIVAVTKGFGPEAARAALAAGLGDLGESYAGELAAKAAALGAGPDGPRWHFLGAVQRNKVRLIAPYVHLWHSVTRVAEGKEIARWSPGAGVLVQITQAPGRRGVAVAQAKDLVARLSDLGLDVRGLMTVGPAGPAEDARPGFRRLAELGADLGLRELSMGMSHDLEVAVSEGATIIRVGRALYGPRPAPKKLQECSLAGGG